MSKTITPRLRLRLLRRDRAKTLGRYPSLLATFQMRCRVGSEIRRADGPLFSTIETVVTETPHSPATSLMVTMIPPWQACCGPARSHNLAPGIETEMQSLPPNRATTEELRGQAQSS